MNFYNAKNLLAEPKVELSNFRKKLYPGFVTSGKGLKAPERIPVFSFHNVTQESFETQLDYLKRNGYETVTADEYLDRCGKTKNERVVALTFDDGHKSLWTIVYPLLKKYGMKAIAFMLPGETSEAVTPRLTYDGALGEGSDDNPLCTWAEFQAMKGVIDIQSHSLYHWIMFTSPKVTGFFSPKIQSKWAAIDHPVTRDDGVDQFKRCYPLGTPFYEMNSRLSDSLRMYEPASVRMVCVKHVSENGGKEFFLRKKWFEELKAIHDKAAEKERFDFESEDARLESVRFCLSESKRLLEERLGTQVRHLCLPFGIGGETVLNAAEETGYGAMYWGVSAPDYAENRAVPKAVTRLKDDYLFRLPGDGRWPLSKIFAAKLKRRLNFAFGGKGELR